MQLLPLVGFYLRRHEQLERLAAKGTSSDATSHLLIDVLVANKGLIAKHFPLLNESGLLDDVISTLQAVLLPSSAAPNSRDLGAQG